MNPASHDFGIGWIERDQLGECAARNGGSLAQAQRWLAPNFGDTA